MLTYEQTLHSELPFTVTGERGFVCVDKPLNNLTPHEARQIALMLIAAAFTQDTRGVR